MEQDLRTCPSCGASAPEHSPCPYCGWTPKLSEVTQAPEDTSHTASIPQSAESAEHSSAGPSETDLVGQADAQLPSEEVPPMGLRDLISPDDEPEHLLEQVPEDMRGVLAARLRATEDPDATSFDEDTTSTLRDQGFLVSEDARGARLTGSTGQTADLSASDVVKMAAGLDGGVQPRTTLPICPKCEAASPIGETNCQWCGEPFPES